MYVLVLERDDYQFLVDPADLWRPPRLIVRRGRIEGVVWLDEDDVSFMKSRFHERDERRILAIVEEHIEDLLCRWADLRNDVRRDRLEERNELIE